ncbi:hypothetical protein ABZ705_05375 [Streptomyces sp. NPDC006984]|uniref:hypothetical protein n=1 Tax=Streptomyces sp. NPDC006984 TaxID=3155463 RepID=UPI0034002F00
MSQPHELLPRDEDRIDRGVEILSQVTLQSFTVSPTAIGPFGMAELSWHVDGPLGFSLELNGILVARQGARVVQPTFSKTYTLTARAFGVRLRLRSVQLTVNTAACLAFEFPSALHFLNGALNTAISQAEGVYPRTEPSVTLREGRVTFTAKLGKDIDKFPDPTIRLSGSFGLDVEDGDLVNRSPVVDADVSMSRWAWLIPGALIALPIAISQAEQRARAGGMQAIDGMTRLLALLWVTGEGMRRHSIRVRADEPDQGFIEATECPADGLRRVARLASAPGTAGPTG